MSEKKKTGLWALLAKFGFKFLGILGKLAKATKFLKFGLAAVSFASYAVMFTWKFAILLMIALAWHESGHVWAMRKSGIKTKGFYFIPFLGGAAIAEEGYKTYGQNSFIAIMGPVWGLILACVCCIVYYATGMPLFAASAGWMAFLNLFNLFPVVPLDGGQIMRSIAFSINKNLGFVFLLLSLIVSTVIMFKLRAGLFAFLIIVGAIDLVVEFFRRKNVNKKHKYYTDLAVLSTDTLGEDNRSTKAYNRLAEQQKLEIPISMRGWQFAASIASYALTTIALIAIIKIMAHVPGADLAEEFLADK